jgi:hypothetical protein
MVPAIVRWGLRRLSEIGHSEPAAATARPNTFSTQQSRTLNNYAALVKVESPPAQAPAFIVDCEQF